MKRKNTSDWRREWTAVVAVGIVLVLMGLFVIVYPCMEPPATYEALTEKEVTVSSVRHVSGGRGANFDRLTTTDNERYNLTGDYDPAAVYAALQSGQRVTVRYYESKLFSKKYAEEILVNGELLVRYNNDEPQYEGLRIALGGVTVLVGIGAFVLCAYFVRQDIFRQAKRDARIQKKYGKRKK